jgi:hypothetical protein
MAQFLGELYLSRGDAGAVVRNAERTRVAAQELTREGVPVRYLRSIFVPEDETCFVLIEARSAEAACQAARRAGLSFERLAEVDTTREEQS